MQAPFDVSDPRLAHAAWSRIAEPGDRDALRLIDAAGASGALEWLYRAVTDRPGAEHPGQRAAVARWAPRLTDLDPRRELRVVQRIGGRLITQLDAEWPAHVASLGLSRPHCLWLIGPPAIRLDELCERSCAIVGTRAPTGYGEFVAAELAALLAGQGHTIISGGAYGIDATAHRAALACGRSVAVQAGGLDRLYPRGNHELLRAVAGTGAIVSEVPPGSVPARYRFLQRNRIIAALSGATIVVEAAWRSGAQSTARHAAELLRPVGAMPGPITSAASAGCHRLIREGVATLLGAPEDALELLRPCGAQGELPLSGANTDPVGAASDRHDTATSGRAEPSGLAPGHSRVYHALPLTGEASGDDVARTCGLAPEDVLAALARLEVGGLVEQHGGRWRRSHAS